MHTDNYESLHGRSRSYSPGGISMGTGIGPSALQVQAPIVASRRTTPTARRGREVVSATHHKPSIVGRRRTTGSTGTKRSSLLKDYTQSHAQDVTTSPLLIRRTTLIPKDRPIFDSKSNDEVPVPVPAPMDDSTESQQSVEEMIRFRVRNPNSLPPAKQPVLVPPPVRAKQLIMAQHHKALHSIVEEDKPTTCSNHSNRSNHSSDSTASSASSVSGKKSGIIITANSSSHDKLKSGGLLGALLSGTMDDSGASFADEEELAPRTTTNKEPDHDTTATAIGSQNEHFRDRSPPSQDGTMCTRVPKTMSAAREKSVAASRDDILNGIENRASLSPPASPTRTTISSNNNKERLMQAAAKAVEDMPVRKARRATETAAIHSVLAPMADASGRINGKRGQVRRSRSDDPTDLETTNPTTTTSTATTTATSTTHEMDAITGDGMNGSGRLGRPLRRSQSSDGAGALGRMRRAGRRSGAAAAEAMDDSCKRALTRTRSSDGTSFANSARGLALRRQSDDKADARKTGFRRSKSSIGASGDAGTDDKTRSLSPTRRSPVKDTGFGANHPARFNSSRIKRWDKDEVGGTGFSSSNFGANELQKMLKNQSNGLYYS
jgi:hypothetical protein